MKTILTLTFAALTLSACDMVEPTPAAAVDTGRQAARIIVGPIVAETVPGPAGVVLTNCIIDNASGPELLTIAASGSSPDNVALVGDILARPATVSCATSALT